MRWRIPLVVGLALFAAVSCEQQPAAPESSQDHQISAAFAHQGTPFTGTATQLCPPAPELGTEKVLPTGQKLQQGWHTFYDFVASDARVTGTGEWWTNKKIEADNSATKIWGKIELVVEGGAGVWDLSFHGYRIGRPPTGRIVLEAVGQGREGIVKGLVGKWTMEMPIRPPCSRVFQVEGDIL